MQSRSSVVYPYSGGKSFVKSGLADDSDRGRAHKLHVPRPSSVPQELGRDGMIVAGKKDDSQKGNRAIHAAAIPILSQLPPTSVISSPTLASLIAPLSLANTVPTSTSLPSVSASPSESAVSPEQDINARSNPPSTSPTSTSPPSKLSSLPFPPALLAFILVCACFFILMMTLALCRIHGRKRNRAQLASPLFLGTATGLGSIHHRNEVFELAKPKMEARDAVLRNEQLRPRRVNRDEKVDPVKDGGTIPTSRTFSSIQTVVPIAPLPAHVNAPAQRSPRRSRVLRPYVARPYHRPHPAFTADPESVMPLIGGGGTADDGDRGANTKDKSEKASARTKVKGKEKENARPGTATSQRRKQRDTLSAAPLNLSDRSLASVTSEPVISPAIPPTSSGTKLELPYSSSAKSITRGVIKDKDMPPLPTGSTAINIGLAMLKEFSSPPIGLGFNLYPQVDLERKNFRLDKGARSNLGDAPSTEEGPAAAAPPNWHLPTSVRATDAKATKDSEGAPVYLAESMSSGSKGLAYLASGSSQDLLALDKMEERDITEKDMVSTPVFDTPRPEFLDEDPVLADSPEAPPARPGFFKAPTLPTLSEMALSRADPLYESVTNELFASYGVRMSTASGTGRMSRVSARLSRMISWFGDATPGERTSRTDTIMPGVDRLSGVGDWLASEEQRMSGATVRGVEPLRIGKLRKIPE